MIFKYFQHLKISYILPRNDSNIIETHTTNNAY